MNKKRSGMTHHCVPPEGKLGMTSVSS